MLDTTKPTTFWSSFQTYNLKWSMDVWKQTAPTALGKTMQKVALVVFPIFLVILYVEIFVKNLVVVTVVKTFTSIAHFIRPPKPEPEKLSQPPAPPSSLTPPVAGGAGVEGAPENPVSNKAPAAAPRALSAPPAGENSLALMPYGAAPTQKTPQPPPPPLLALTGPDTVQSLGQTNWNLPQIANRVGEAATAFALGSAIVGTPVACVVGGSGAIAYGIYELRNHPNKMQTVQTKLYTLLNWIIPSD